MLQKNQLTTWAIGSAEQEGDFAGQAHAWRGKVAPRLYGQRADMVKILTVNQGFTLANDLDSSNTILTLVDVGSGATNIPSIGGFIIDGEKMNYNTNLGPNLFTVCRGIFDTPAFSHLAGANISVYAALTGAFMRFSHFKGIVTSADDLGSIYIDDIIPELTASFINISLQVYKLDTDNSVQELKVGTKLSYYVFRPAVHN